MMHVALLATVAVMQVSPPPRRPPAQMQVRADSHIVINNFLLGERRFLAYWETEWLESERDRYPTYYRFQGVLPPGAKFGIELPEFDPRQVDQACYFGWKAPQNNIPVQLSDYSWGIPARDRQIASKRNPEHWVCPNWLPPRDYFFTGPTFEDEREMTDGPIARTRRDAMKRARSAVLRQLEPLLQRFPQHDLLLGQKVRLLVDNDQVDSATRVAERCAGSRWWCSMLAGYTYHRANRIAAADSAFTLALATAPAAERCAFNDVRVLFDDNDRRPYERLTCAQRDSVNARIWWLSDPLWSIPGNDRKVEQFVRAATIRLKSATIRDARFDWSPQGGGDALAEMVMRYGWPSFTYYSPARPQLVVQFPPPKAPKYGYVLLYQPAPKGKPLVDPDRIEWAKGLRTTFEYSLGRAHVIPPWFMVHDPYSIVNSLWSLSAPAGEWDHKFNWWPVEHYMPPFPIIPITDQQTAFLRRDTNAVFAYATNLTRVDFAQLVNDSANVHMIVSTDPSSFVHAPVQRKRATDRVVFVESMPSRPALVGVEIPWDSAGRPGVRARFGVRPPAPLRELARGSVAVSEPVVLIAPPDGSPLPVSADSALQFMAGTTTLLPTTRAIGVYWEAYGFARTDSVDVSVGVRGANATSITWREPSPERTTHTIAGVVPIQMRSVVLNIETLPPGTYQLEVAVRRVDGAEARSARQIVVR
ncbi:MAG TPA: hypothetical protein VJR92_11595 [Gemmatimonadaceae bacterium]|nr:hypothetical protein [Gemmatimonadaceae bacterium]